MHRWTAAALITRADDGQRVEAHRRAAQFWQWRVDVWPQDRTTDIQQLVEARYHHHQAHDLDDAIRVTGQICVQLHTWGAWTWEEDLCTETLTWLPPKSRAATAFTHQLGMIAERRGDYAQAEQRYQASLTIKEELGDRAGISASYHQLGMIAQRRGDYAQAEQRYQASLTINEELGDRAGIASTTSQLGVLRTVQGRSAEGIHYNVSALALRLEIESPEISTDIYWLAKQRRETGEEAFEKILGELMDAGSVQSVINAVNSVQPDELD